MGIEKTTRLAYAKAMSDHGCGFGFLETESLKRVRRGMCGYLDSDGCWHPIVDLTDSDALDEGRYDPPGRLIPGEPAEAEWGVRTAQGTMVGSPTLVGGGGAGGIGAKVAISITCSRDSGAVVLCNSPVRMECYDCRSVLRRWAEANAETILENCEDVKESGFYIVEATWASEDVYLNAWIGQKKELSIGGTVSAGDVAGGTASVLFRHESSADGWIHPVPFDGGEPETRVLFFKGLRFKLRSFIGAKWISESRGDEEGVIITDPNDETKKYILEVETEDGEPVYDYM